MTNQEIYGKTIGFSIRRLLWDLLSLLIVAALASIGFFAAEQLANMGLAGLGIGLLVGIIIVAILSRYISYTFKAGQIAMMTRGVTEGALPTDVIAEGKRTVKERFVTVAAFFAVTGIIKGTFHEIGRGLEGLGRSLGGDTGSSIGSAISAVVNVVVAYLCDCCLGWVFFRRDQKATKATLEGAVIFFKHGKTLARNLGRVFGMGIVSLVVIGGVFGGLAYLIFSRFPAMFQTLATEISEAAVRYEVTLPAQMSDPFILTIIAAVIVGIIIWSFLHSTFVRPFVLVGVLRNYLESGMADIPTEDSFAELDSKSKKFAKAHRELATA